uniref:Uncharacterized protein n=1 Tax=Arabidopsis thaliana TaxID=3702 RepID=Q56WT5_ARATH|nr:hypothetical protein [Arabidopsis thaliana]
MHVPAPDFRTCLTCCPNPPTKKKNIFFRFILLVTFVRVQ